MPKYTTLTSVRYFTDIQSSEQSDASLNEFIDMATAQIDDETARTWQRPQTTGYVYLDGDDTSQLYLPNTDIQQVLALYIDDDGDGSYTRVHAESNLNGDINDSATTVVVDDTTDFPSTGTLYIEGETITYTGKTSTDFTGCTRGGGTGAASHSDRVAVYWISNNYIKVYEVEGIINLLDDASLNVFTAGSLAVKIKYKHGAVQKTTLDSALATTDGTSITVHTSVDYPDKGYVIIDSEWMKYTGSTSTTFTGLTRGALGTTASTHADESVVYEAAPDELRLLCNQVVSGYMHTGKEDDLAGKIRKGLDHQSWGRPYLA